MADRKFGPKVTPIRGHVADHIDGRFQKIRNHKRSDSVTFAKMSDGRILVNDTVKSDYDELIALIKNWSGQSRGRYPTAARLGTGAVAKGILSRLSR